MRAFALTLVVWLAAFALPTSAASTTIRVKAFKFGFTLSSKSASRGTVTFMIKNTGFTAHDFWIDGKRSRIIPSGQTARLTVTFTKPGRYPYRCTISTHAWGGMKGILTVR